MTNEEIYDLASRYEDEENFQPIPQAGEVFALLRRTLPDNKILKDSEGWEFGGYAQLTSIEIDYNAKPEGKWLLMNYLSLASFPPQHIELRLQPPHIALGFFRDPSKTIETKIVVLPGIDEDDDRDDNDDADKGNDGPTILSFPGKR